MVAVTRFSLVLLLASGSVFASPVKSRTPYAVKDSHFVPRKWKRVAEAPADAPLSLQIGLKQSRFDELERQLYEVSDPDHPRYGKHLSVEDVNELVKPHDESVDLVHQWLADNGIEADQLGYSQAKDWIIVTLPIEKVEQLLDTKYATYEHVDGSRLIRTTSWSLPVHLHEHIENIQPTNAFFRSEPKRSSLKIASDWKKADGKGFPSQSSAKYSASNSSVDSVCDTDLVTPLCLRTFYGTINYTAQVPGQNKVGLNDFLGESNNRSDTKLFLEKYRPEAASAAYSFEVVIIDNGNDEQTQETPEELEDGKDLEGNLDSETILGIGYPTPLTAFTTGGSPPYIPDAYTTSNTNEPYLTWVQYVLNSSDIPQVISTSYDDDEQTVPLSYATTVCKLFAQLGARGVSLLFASGDDGVGPDGYCYSNDGKNTSMFIPEFPSSCPYVTSVGATKNFDPEVTAYDTSNGFSSGGGFSNYFARPSYQDEAVKSYLSALGDEYSGLFNSSGRAYPDISAQGQRYGTVWNGTTVILDGTSASTPCASAILSLVNDALIAEGKSPLGFLNPWLYKTGYKAFSDITSGSAIGCGVDGFPAVEGWDPVTGWGTPYFPSVVKAALAANSSSTNTTSTYKLF